MPQKHYTPPLSRFNVCALYHEAKQRKIPMTQLVNNLVEAGLRDTAGWREAQDQMTGFHSPLGPNCPALKVSCPVPLVAFSVFLAVKQRLSGNTN